MRQSFLRYPVRLPDPRVKSMGAAGPPSGGRWTILQLLLGIEGVLGGEEVYSGSLPDAGGGKNDAGGAKAIPLSAVSGEGGRIPVLVEAAGPGHAEHGHALDEWGSARPVAPARRAVPDKGNNLDSRHAFDEGSVRRVLDELMATCPKLQQVVDLDRTAARLALKALAACQRGCCRCLKDQGLSILAATETHRAIKETQQQLFPKDGYIPGLNLRNCPGSAGIWFDLSTAYGGLLLAQVALSVLKECRRIPSRRTAYPLLESVGAAQKCVRRILECSFPGERCDQDQLSIYHECRQLAHGYRLYVPTLGPECRVGDPITEVRRLWSRLLDTAWEEEVLHSQEQHLDEIRRLVDKRDFGIGQHDGGKLYVLLRKAFSTGVDPKNRDLLQLVTPFSALLRGNTKNPSVRELVAALDGPRLAPAIRRAATARDSPPAIPQELRAVLKYTGGKRVLLVGGLPREHSRRNIEDGLRLRQLDWVATTGRESPHDFEAGIRNSDTDIVLLAVRWARTGWKSIRELAERHGKRFALLKAGYGLNRVAKDLYDQWCREETKRRAAG